MDWSEAVANDADDEDEDDDDEDDEDEDEDRCAEDDVAPSMGDGAAYPLVSVLSPNRSVE